MRPSRISARAPRRCRSRTPAFATAASSPTSRSRTLTGHKLPTGYPSRRAWLHVTVRDRAGARHLRVGCGCRERRHLRQRPRCGRAARRAALHRDRRAGPGADLRIGHARSGRKADDRSADRGGLCKGQPAAAARIPEDHRRIPGLPLSARRHRMPTLPAQATASAMPLDVRNAEGPFAIDAELRYQVIGFRWAENLRAYQSEETRRFVGYYESMAPSSSEVLASARSGRPEGVRQG